jgi:hypothetical protein
MSTTSTIEITGITLDGNGDPTDMSIRIYDSQGNTENITSDTTTRTNALSSTQEDTSSNFTGSAGNAAKIINREIFAGNGAFDFKVGSGISNIRTVYNDSTAVNKLNASSSTTYTGFYAGNEGGYGNTYIGYNKSGNTYYFFNVNQVAYPINTVDITGVVLLNNTSNGVFNISTSVNTSSSSGSNTITQGSTTAKVVDTRTGTYSVPYSNLQNGPFTSGSVTIGSETRTITDVISGTPVGINFNVFNRNGGFLSTDTANVGPTLLNPVTDDSDPNNLAGSESFAFGVNMMQPFFVRANNSLGSYQPRYSGNFSSTRSEGNINPLNGTLDVSTIPGSLVMVGDTITQTFSGTGEGTVSATVSSIIDTDSFEYSGRSYTGDIEIFQPGIPNVSIGSNTDLEISEHTLDTINGFWTLNKNGYGDTFLGFNPNPDDSEYYYYFMHITSACLHEDSLIETEQGIMKISNLHRGMMIKTMNKGYLPLARLGKTRTIGECPYIIFEKDSIEPGLPTHRLMITPGHPMWHKGQFVDPRDFAESDEYPGVIAKNLNAHAYYHLVFESHEVFYANGVGVTSLPHNTSYSHAFLKQTEYFDETKYDPDIIGKMEPPHILHEDPLNPPVDPSRVSKVTVKEPTEELIKSLINNNSKDNSEYDSDTDTDCGSVLSVASSVMSTGGGGGGGNLSD